MGKIVLIINSCGIMKMKEKLKTELQRLGLMPIEEEFGIVFKYQMLNYIWMILLV